MTSNSCYLGQLVNHDNRVRIGYNKWLTEPDKVHAYIESNEMVGSSWPKDGIIEPPSKGIDYTEMRVEIVRVLATGSEYTIIYILYYL